VSLSRADEASPVQSLEARLRRSHEAGEWWVRRQQDGWTPEDEQALAIWLAGDPQRRAAFESVQRSWRDAAELRHHFPQAYTHGEKTRRASDRRMASPISGWVQVLRRLVHGGGSWARGPALSAGLATAFLCIGLFGGYGWYHWAYLPQYTLSIATGPGELRAVQLPDGSRIDLNTRSTLQVRYYAQRREVLLDQGEAFFQVAPDADRPFTVDSGRSRVRVLGTAFNVRVASPAMVVQVQQGRVAVRVDRARSDTEALVMGPGAGVAIDNRTLAYRIVPTSASAVAEWRSGQLYFKQVPLREVARELARYLGAPVSVDGDALGATPISGLLALREPERFLLALPSLIDARVEQMADGHWHITPL